VSFLSRCCGRFPTRTEHPHPGSTVLDRNPGLTLRLLGGSQGDPSQERGFAQHSVATSRSTVEAIGVRPDAPRPSFPRSRQIRSNFSIGWLRNEVMEWLKALPTTKWNAVERSDPIDSLLGKAGASTDEAGMNRYRFSGPVKGTTPSKQAVFAFKGAFLTANSRGYSGDALHHRNANRIDQLGSQAARATPATGDREGGDSSPVTCHSSRPPRHPRHR
jgi:predicted DNA-binding transcriptional regulator AlpA